MISYNELSSMLNKCILTEKSIIYCRSSTQSQNNFNHCSIDTQIFNNRQYCMKNNLKIFNMSTEICSATQLKNQKTLLHIINNFSNINIIVYDASRFSRNIIDGIKLLNLCIDKNINIYNVKDNYSTNTTQGYYNFIDGIKNAELESKLISDRMKSSINYRKNLGFDFGIPPYGYMRDRINGIIKFVKCNKETEIIDFGRALYYGCTLNEANKKMVSITGHKINSLFSEPCYKIEYGNFTFKMLAEFLNENNIKHRNKDWTANSVSTIITTDPIIGKRKNEDDKNTNKKSKNLII